MQQKVILALATLNQEVAVEHAPKVLVIEDDPKIARFIELELQCEGFQVICAPDGMEGLMQARTEQPDIIILDWMLPELDGLEVCQRLRRSSDVPIIMLTARTDYKDRVEGLDGGANDYWSNPLISMSCSPVSVCSCAAANRLCLSSWPLETSASISTAVRCGAPSTP